MAWSATGELFTACSLCSKQMLIHCWPVPPVIDAPAVQRLALKCGLSGPGGVNIIAGDHRWAAPPTPSRVYSCSTQCLLAVSCCFVVIVLPDGEKANLRFLTYSKFLFLIIYNIKNIIINPVTIIITIFNFVKLFAFKITVAIEVIGIKGSFSRT